MRARVVVFNGVGGVGKSSTARALQRLASQPWLHVQGDTFLDMITPRLWNDPEGITFKRLDGFVPSIEIKMGPALDRLMEGMRQSIVTLARAGNDCLVDDVMLSPSDQRSYIHNGAELDLQFVALHAPLDVLEKRERERGDRAIGLARWQFPRVHAGMKYDFEIDTSQEEPEAIARAIASALAIPLLES